jgi:hypothetical protein
MPVSRLLIVACCAGLALAGAPAEPPALLPLYDLEGDAVDPFRDARASATVFFFLRTDCPVSNGYAPEIRRLHDRFAPRGVAFWAVYLDPDQNSREIRRHLEEFQIPGSPLRDSLHALAGRCGARVTPEAAVFSMDGQLTYVGRIDDRYVAYGKQKRAAATHDVEDALAAALTGRSPAPAKGPAIGCLIRDLR